MFTVDGRIGQLRVTDVGEWIADDLQMAPISQHQTTEAGPPDSKGVLNVVATTDR